MASQRFDRRIAAEPEAARAEAVVFKFLTDEGLHPRVLEDASSGGADFECDSGSRFAVEVTALTTETFGERSGFDPNVVEAGTMDTAAVLSLLRSRISKKGTIRQAVSYPGPRVLAIVSEHYMATVAFLATAPELLTGQVGFAWQVSPAGPVGDAYQYTEFAHAAHIRSDVAGNIEVFRRKHALILLIALRADGANIVGVANPEPDQVLPSLAFANIPIASLKWPPDANHLDVTWSLSGRPYEYIFR